MSSSPAQSATATRLATARSTVRREGRRPSQTTRASRRADHAPRRRNYPRAQKRGAAHVARRQCEGAIEVGLVSWTRKQGSIRMSAAADLFAFAGSPLSERLDQYGSKLILP